MPLALAHTLPTVGLEELNEAAELLTRTDRKYLLDAKAAGELLSALPEPARVLEITSRRCFAYDSVYFDSAGLESYHLASGGRRRRYKVRVRTYEDSGLSFLEVKTRGSRSTTVKERLPYSSANRFQLTPEAVAYVQERLADCIGRGAPLPLEPVLQTRYDRITLFLPCSRGRVTVDTGARWRSLRGQTSHGPWLHLCGKAIVETKSGSTAGPVDRWLWRNGVRPSRVSKFGTGMAALNPELPANRWHRALSRDFQLTPVFTPVNPFDNES